MVSSVYIKKQKLKKKNKNKIKIKMMILRTINHEMVVIKMKKFRVFFRLAAVSLLYTPRDTRVRVVCIWFTIYENLVPAKI